MKTICVHRINSNGLSVGGDEYYCYDEKRYNLNKCDIICTNRSTLPFVVQYVSILTSSGENIKVPKLTIFSINGVATTSTFNNNNMETKNIQVTIEQAREWFNSNNQALRTLAINAFGEERLSMTYESIRCKVDSLATCVEVPALEENAFIVNAKLAILARYFNGPWHRNVYNTGYFIGARRNTACGTGPVAVIDRLVGVYKHDTVLYGGIVYFENANDATKAAELLGSDLNCLLGI